jgi:hypothetical protein
MAGRPKNRLELRRQYEAAEPPDPIEDEPEEIVEETDDEEVERRPKRKVKPAKPKAKSTKGSKAAKPAARMRVVWVVLNDAFKPIATFEYSQREAADAKAAEMTARGKGTHFVQRSKEAMPEDAPGLGAAIPRPEVPSRTKSKKAAPAAVAAVEEEEEIEAEEEPEEEEEIEEEEDEE